MNEPPSFVQPSILTVCIDFRDPLAYLAKDPTCLLEKEFPISIDWQPLQVPPMKPPQAAVTGDDRGTRHRRYRAEAAAKDIFRYAEIRGLQLNGIYSEADSSLAGIGLLWVKQQSGEIQHRYIDLVFERFARRTLDIESFEAIALLLHEAGAATEGLEQFVTGDGRAMFNLLQLELGQTGVFSVPAYLIDGEIFHGRQHLPMIRWILSDRQGEPPI